MTVLTGTRSRSEAGMAKKRGGLVTTANDLLNRTSGQRHLRRKAERLAKKHPSEVNKALRMLEERHDK